MNRLKKMYSVIAVAVFALGMVGVPAQAATSPSVGVCEGTLTVSPGLGSPILVDFTWQLEATCTVVSGDGVEIMGLGAGGSGTGTCGWSTASGGSGTLSSGSQTIALANVGWTGAGHRTLLVSGNHDAGGLGSYVAEVATQGGAACLTTGATDFTVMIVAELA